MSDRLHAVVGVANKGSHFSVSKQEADRCVIYTYMLVGDILSLQEPPLTNISRAAENDVMSPPRMVSDEDLSAQGTQAKTIQ